MRGFRRQAEVSPLDGFDFAAELSAAFNGMANDLQTGAAALAESDRARQLLADVSHELMTPAERLPIR